MRHVGQKTFFPLSGIGVIARGVILSMALFVSCNDTQPPVQPAAVPPLHTSHRAAVYPAQCPPGVWNDSLACHVYYPKGGEVFYVGDTVCLGFCDTDTSRPFAVRGCVYLGFAAGMYLHTLTQSECGTTNPMPWIVQDSVPIFIDASTVKNVSIVGERCRIRLEEYFGTQYHESGFFAIRRR